ncbi:sodium:calcium antiporter [Halorussus halophilus]|uniref:sodium:calcium antiporter n=1 Tax=Halorussus halophilus TaxID=2650975 RepID=UPI001CE3C6E3|nr:hypothetical protein [Halorussus halophilus]
MVVSPRTVVVILVGAVALAALVKSAAVAVERFVRVARQYDVDEAIVGMTVVAFGTSLPEIAANLIASLGILSGTLDYGVASATVLGGSVGSSMFQQTLLVGAFLLGFGTVTLSRSFLRASYVPMVLSVALTLALAADGTISHLDGGVLVGAFVVYLYYTFDRRERTLPEAVEPESEDERAPGDVRLDAAVGLLGLVTVLVSAYVTLAVLEELVAVLRLGGSMVGVVTLGVGAALPELSTVAEAVRRRTPTLALGTLVGSNVVNTLVAIGIGGLVSSYRVPQPVVLWDLPLMLVVGGGVLGYVLFVTDGRLGRRDAASLVVAYFVFVSGRLLLFGGQ